MAVVLESPLHEDEMKLVWGNVPLSIRGRAGVLTRPGGLSVCLRWTFPVPFVTALPSLFSQLLIFLRCRQAQTHSLGEARKNRAIYISVQVLENPFILHR